MPESPRSDSGHSGYTEWDDESVRRPSAIGRGAFQAMFFSYFFHVSRVFRVREGVGYPKSRRQKACFGRFEGHLRPTHRETTLRWVDSSREMDLARIIARARPGNSEVGSIEP